MAYRYVKRTGRRARKRPGESLVAKGKKPPVGTGARFKALEKGLAKKKGVRTPGKLAAYIGRKKYGKKRFQKMAAAGRKRARRRRG